MGNNLEKKDGDNHGILKTPLYSSGTSEMETSNISGKVDGPKSPPSMDTSHATVHSGK